MATQTQCDCASAGIAQPLGRRHSALSIIANCWRSSRHPPGTCTNGTEIAASGGQYDLMPNWVSAGASLRKSSEHTSGRPPGRIPSGLVASGARGVEAASSSHDVAPSARTGSPSLDDVVVPVRSSPPSAPQAARTTMRSRRRSRIRTILSTGPLDGHRPFRMGAARSARPCYLRAGRAHGRHPGPLQPAAGGSLRMFVSSPRVLVLMLGSGDVSGRSGSVPRRPTQLTSVSSLDRDSSARNEDRRAPSAAHALGPRQGLPVLAS